MGSYPLSTQTLYWLRTHGAFDGRSWCLLQNVTICVEKDDFLGPTMIYQVWPHWRNKIEAGAQIRSSIKHSMWLWGLHGGDACLRSADPADVVVPHIPVGGNPLLASSPTTRFAPNNFAKPLGVWNSIKNLVKGLPKRQVQILYLGSTSVWSSLNNFKWEAS